MKKAYTLTERDINMIKWGSELLIVTNADIETVQNVVNRVTAMDMGINEICDIINNMGYMATWENFNDMRLEIK